MFWSSSLRSTAAKALIYVVVLHAVYLGSLWQFADSQCRVVVAVVSLWWAGLYVSALGRLRLRDGVAAAVVAAAYLLVHHWLKEPWNWREQPLANLAVVVAQAVLVTSPIGINVAVRRIGQALMERTGRSRIL